MLQIIQMVDNFGDRVAGSNLVIELGINRDINVFADSCADNGALLFLIKRG
jgi:hypothetical protein